MRLCRMRDAVHSAVLRQPCAPAPRIAWCVLLVLGLVVALPAQALEVRVAVAANFLTTARVLAAGFEKSGGEPVVFSFGSTGQLAAQIRHGAPFDVFLAADAERPRLLEREGFAVIGSRFTYAIGRLVLWSAKPGYVDGAGGVLRTGRFEHLAIANPRTAPYGTAARQVLKALGLWGSLRERLVLGENISQTYQFVVSGNAPLGFVALSEVVGRPAAGSRWLVPQSLYGPIEQQAVLLTHAGDRAGARRFLAYLRSDAGTTAIERFGYGVP